MITLDDFKKVELTVGEILSAEKLPETDKLLKLSVDFGFRLNTDKEPPRLEDSTPPLSKGGDEVTQKDIRQIVSGIAVHFPEPEKLVGKKCLFVTNLEPRVIRGVQSNGMIVAVSTDDGKFSLFEVNNEIPSGTKAR